MSIPHRLQDEFPGLAPLIERLVKSSYEFGRLAEAYEVVNGEIWRLEATARLTADETVEKLKKRRLLLRDDIALLLDREQRRA